MRQSHSLAPMVVLTEPQTLRELENLACEGDTKAQYTLGYLHYAGCANMSHEWFRRHMEKDGYLLSSFTHPIVVPQANYKTARLLLEDAAAGGVPGALKLLGTLFAVGAGVDRDNRKAMEYYRRAAGKGSALALCSMAQMYLEGGPGVKPSYTKAFRHYERAATLGSCDAFFNLGVLYKRGVGVLRNDAQAAAMFSRAVELARDLADGAQCASTLASSLYNLGTMHRKGLGVERDYWRAIHYYNESARLGNGSAATNLGIMYSRGLGVSRDLEAAKEYLSLGASLGDETAGECLKNLLDSIEHGVLGVFSRSTLEPRDPQGEYTGSVGNPAAALLNRRTILPEEEEGANQAQAELTRESEEEERQAQELVQPLLPVPLDPAFASAFVPDADEPRCDTSGWFRATVSAMPRQEPFPPTQVMEAGVGMSSDLPALVEWRESELCRLRKENARLEEQNRQLKRERFSRLVLPSELFCVFRSKTGREYQFLPFAPKLAGTAPGTMYRKVKSGDLGTGGSSAWLGKIGAGKPIHVGDKYSAVVRSRKRVNTDTIFEKVAGDCYSFLSQGRYVTPKMRLARLPLMNEFLVDHELAKFMMHSLADERCSRKSVRARPSTQEKPICTLRVMSKWIPGYIDLVELVVPTVPGTVFKLTFYLGPGGGGSLDGACPGEVDFIPFMEYVRRFETLPEYILQADQGRVVPLHGLIPLLAVGTVIGDTDVIGSGGTNAGVVFRTSKSEPHCCTAVAVKVDPGFAFNVDFSEVARHHQTPNRFLNAVEGRGVTFALDDLRDIQIGNNCSFVVRFERLSTRQQQEFIAVHQECLSVLQRPAMLEMLFMRGGLFVDGKDRGERLSELTVVAYVGFMRSYFEYRKLLYVLK